MTEETSVRKAQTKLPDGTLIERDWNARERYQLYVRGFRDGAAVKAMRDDHIGLGAYDRGYGDGRRALVLAAATYAEEVEYEPSILRAAAESEGVAK